MKPWVLALGLSVGLHLVLVMSFRGDPVVVERPRERVVDTEAVFTELIKAPAVIAAPAAPRVRTGGRTSPGAELRLMAPLAEPGLDSPLPDPLPHGGEGDTQRADEVTTAAVSDSVSDAVAAPAPQGPGPELVALVHGRLAAMAEGCYPAAARRFQQRGTVQLSFCLDANGGAASTSVTQSSGAELLDAAAQGCVVQKAAPFPLEAAARCFSVPVRFGAR